MFCADKYLILWREILATVRDFINTPNFKKIFICGIVLYLIGLFALLRGNIYFMDDWGHSSGDASWNHFSRYLTTFVLTSLLTLGKGNIDASPLTQILAVILVVISSMILLYLIRKKFDFLGIIASLPLGLSPYFLENLSYKFDSLTMALALFFATIPFLFKKHTNIFIAISVISLLCMLMTYQAANGIYIVLSLYFAFSAFFYKNHTFKASVKFLAICAMNLIVASAFYKIFIMTPINEYATPSYVNGKIIALNASFFLCLWENLSTYLITIFNDFKQTPYIWLISLVCVLFIINAVLYSNKNKIVSIFGGILFIMLGLCLSYGLYLLLEKPLFAPHAIYGFNAFIATLCITNISFAPPHTKKYINLNCFTKITHCALKTISIAIAVLVGYFCISFANIYGNALKAQDNYIAYRANLLAQDLAENLPYNAYIVVKGSIGFSKVTNRFINKYGDISRTIKEVYKNVNWVLWYLGYHNAPYSNFGYGGDEICDFLYEKFGSEIILQNAYHKIEKSKICYIITVK